MSLEEFLKNFNAISFSQIIMSSEGELLKVLEIVHIFND